ncbi:MAG: ABC transporter permease [Armatimonadota bacterium]|nr:ABC transporter permease [Armatimonadota bacterium]
MRPLAAHFLADLRLLARMPAYTIPTLLLPSLFFLMFAGQRIPRGVPTVVPVASFATFAVFGVVFFKFGVSTAMDRAAPWTRYVRTLALAPGTVLAARALSAVVFALLAAFAVFATARMTMAIGLAPVQLGRVLVGLLAGALPFTLCGIAVGYWTSPRSAVAMANLLYLLLSYGGGLWTPPDLLPPGVRDVAVVLPTYHWGRVVWAAALALPWRTADWLALAAWTVVFGAAAWRGYVRDEGALYG